MNVAKSIILSSVLLLVACTGFQLPESYPSGVIAGTEFATTPFRIAADTPVYERTAPRQFEIPSDLTALHYLEQCLPGTVVMEFMVAPDGQPVNVRIIDSQPAGAYDRVAFLAIRESRFEPTIVDGHWQPETQRRPVAFDVPESCSN